MLNSKRLSISLILHNESSNTIGNFIDSVVVGNPGSGYTDGQYFDLSLDGGAGNDLRVNLIDPSDSISWKPNEE